jgi:histidinol-phosphate/aromatic aminotransferase/cobyric acid decarboxylase-like protein
MIFPELKVNPLDRKRLSFLDGYFYLGRNMIRDSHGEGIIRRLIQSFDVQEIQDYPDVDSTLKNLQSFLNAPKKNLFLTQGIEGGIKSLLETYDLSHSKACILEPTYKMYEIFCKSYGVDLIKLKSFDISDIKKIIPKLSILFIDNPKCHFENFFEPEEIKKLIRECKKHNVLFFLDEAYEGFGAKSFLKNTPDFFDNEQYDNVILACSFSKKYALPSIKSGFLITNEKIRKCLSSTSLSYELNYFACQTINFVIDNFSYFENFSDRIIKEREALKKRLSDLKEIKVYGDYTHTLRIHSSEPAIKKIESSFRKNKIILNEIDKTNLLMTVSLNENIKSRILKSLDDYREKTSI